jgi:TctA family transporter
MDFYLLALLALFAGVIYGLFIGIIPAAGATTGLVALFPFIVELKSVDPYLAVIFIVAIVASSTTGDTFTSVLLGIPGANSSAATMVDGFPLAQQGKATYALSAAVTTSTVNGLIWGSLVFLLLPWYYDFVILPPVSGGVGQAELFMLCVLAFVTVSFVSTRSWTKSLLALAFGVFLALIGTDPITAAPRLTMGMDFLIGSGDGKGMPLIPVMAGIFAMPEMIMALKNKVLTSKFRTDHKQQVVDGIKISFKEWKLSARGGLIGAVIGFLPGLGGGMSDWLAYGQAVATNPNEKIPFGKGNIKGVIGPEGSNNAQKAASFIPTVLFGIPGASFAAIVIALFSAIGFELTLDSASIMRDSLFFDAMSFGFLTATLITGFICLWLMKYITKIAYVPFKYYFPVLLAFIIWATYTAGFNTYGIEYVGLLGVFTVIGLGMKKFRFSRPALMIGFILGDKIELLGDQVLNLFNIGGYPLVKLTELFGGDTIGQGRLNVALAEGKDLLDHPVFVVVFVLTLIVMVWGWKNKGKVDYA